MKINLLTYAMLIGLPAFSTATAQLSFDARQLDFKPATTDLAAVGEFAFTNAGNQTVTVIEVKPSCGCTTAELEKKVYAPGEKGTIKATFTFGDRVGLQQKHIMLRTDTPEEPLTQLTLRAFIPELLKAEPRSVRWEQKEAAAARTVELSTGTNLPIRVLGVETTDERLFAKLAIVEAGKKYRVTITATDTVEPMQAMLRVKTDYPAEHPKVYFVPVEIGSVAPFPPVAAPVSAAKAAAVPPPEKRIISPAVGQ